METIKTMEPAESVESLEAAETDTGALARRKKPKITFVDLSENELPWMNQTCIRQWAAILSSSRENYRTAKRRVHNAQTVRRARIKKGLTMAQLADAMGVNRQALNEMELGHSCSLSRKHLLWLSETLEIKLAGVHDRA